MEALFLDNICYSYSDEQVTISNLSLNVEEGSFTTLLGPSGCGKTTLLRLIAGFIQPSSGSIKLNGVDQKNIAPENRHIGFVFQDYALFPHLTVRQNILYGLKLQKLSKTSMEESVADIANNLDLVDLLERYPNELSGGQQQRVALARALVLKPQLLLMDEPLSSLDAKLRVKVREELKEIQQKYKITTVYVTHDQEEALSLSDNIAVINDGKILQVGSPFKLYYEPLDHYTADFVGRANFVSDGNKEILIRPEWVRLATNDEQSDFVGTVVSKSFLGERTRLVLDNNGRLFIADLPTLTTDFSAKTVALKFTHSCQIAK